MSESAESSGRAAKMRRTRIAITEHARKLTAEHGLGGFTVETLCEQVGISRRTFFNYFPSKTEAVIGTPSDPLESDAVQRFVAAGTRSGQISPTLLDEMVEVAIEMMDEVFDVAGTITHVNQIIAREPAFMEKFLSDSEEIHRQFAALIAEREGLAPDDPRVGLAIQVLGAMLHSTAHAFFDARSTGSIGPRLRDTLARTRELFTGTDPADPTESAEPTEPTEPTDPVTSAR